MNSEPDFITTLNRKPDVQVLFKFNGERMKPVYNGYRPDHLIKDDYLTTGIHYYYDVTEVPPDGQTMGTITFITPEAYPHCLWIGKKIKIQEGEKIVGCAEIIEIFNSILER